MKSSDLLVFFTFTVKNPFSGNINRRLRMCIVLFKFGRLLCKVSIEIRLCLCRVRQTSKRRYLQHLVWLGRTGWREWPRNSHSGGVSQTRSENSRGYFHLEKEKNYWKEVVVPVTDLNGISYIVAQSKVLWGKELKIWLCLFALLFS